MSSWKSADLSAFTPPALDTLISTARTTANVVSGVLNVVKTAINAISFLLISFPIFDFASALIAAIDAFKEDFLGTGIYACNMWDYPLRQLNRSGISGESFEEFESDVISSFSDDRDPNVPPFSSNAAMLVLVGSAPGLGPIVDLMENISESFSWWEEIGAVLKELRRRQSVEFVSDIEARIKSGDIKLNLHPSVQTQLLVQLSDVKGHMLRLPPAEVQAAVDDHLPASVTTAKQVQEFINGFNEATSPSSYPDWQMISLRTIVPPLPDAIDQVFQPLVDMLQSGRDIVATFEAFIAALEAKIDGLDTIINNIEEYLALLEGLTSLTGLHALFVETDDGVEGLINGLLTASDKPYEGSDSAFFAGLVLVAGGPGLTPFKNLFQPIGS